MSSQGGEAGKAPGGMRPPGLSMKKIKLGLVVSKFNWSITSKMEIAARGQAKKRGAEIAAVSYSPGCCDSPYAAMQMLKAKKVDAIVVLGVLLHGKTKHDEVVAISAFGALQQLSIMYGKPVGFGIIGPGATKKIAHERAEDYAVRSVDAAIDLASGDVSRPREHR